MAVRVVLSASEQHMRSMAQHVRRLQDDGAEVLLVTANRPWASLGRHLDEAGVDRARLRGVDAVSHVNGRPQDLDGDVLYLASPNMLELMAMRTEQWARRMNQPHVVLDNLNALALYNDVAPVQELGHYLANRLRSLGVPGDFLVLGDARGDELLAAMTGFTDGQVELAA